MEVGRRRYLGSGGVFLSKQTGPIIAATELGLWCLTGFFCPQWFIGGWPHTSVRESPYALLNSFSLQQSLPHQRFRGTLKSVWEHCTPLLVGKCIRVSSYISLPVRTCLNFGLWAVGRYWRWTVSPLPLLMWPELLYTQIKNVPHTSVVLILKLKIYFIYISWIHHMCITLLWCSDMISVYSLTIKQILHWGALKITDKEITSFQPIYKMTQWSVVVMLALFHSLLKKQRWYWGEPLLWCYLCLKKG